jgi:predicted PurR-regulated permease PerM
MTPANRTLLIPLTLIAVILVGWVLHQAAGILQPLVIALLLATLLAPLLRALQRFKIPPAVSVLTLVVLLFFGLFQVAVVTRQNIEAFLRDTPLPADARGARSQSPAPAAKAEPPVQAEPPAPAAPAESGAAPDALAAGEPSEPSGAGDPRGSDDDNGLLSTVRDQQEAAIRDAGGLGNIVDKLVTRIEGSSLPDPVVGYLRTELFELKNQSRAAEVAQRFLGGGLDLSRTLLLVVIYMAFIFAEASIFKRKILAVSGENRDEAERILDTIAKGMQQFLGIKTLISLATGACAYLLLVLLKVPYALLFGFLTFALNFIPYFGSIVAGIMPTVVAIAVEPSLDKAIICAIGYVLINTVLGTILEPRIMGRELDLSPLVIIVSVIVWGSLWGVTGTFLAVPIMAVLQTVLASSESTRPLAVLLSGGPPKESGRHIFRRHPAAETEVS